MASLNRVFLMGNLTRDPELRYTPQGVPVCSATLAINYRWKAEDGTQKDEVTFLDCVAFARRAEVINEYARKGSLIMLAGRLKQDNWEDKQTGAKRSKIKMIVESFQFLGGKPGGAESGDGAPSAPRPATASAPDPAGGHGHAAEDDDVPF